MRAKFTRYGPASDYRGAIVLDLHGRLANIGSVYYRETPPAFMAKLRRFDGSDAGEQTLVSLEILEREWDEDPH